jgi:LPS-assembly lipoprotein
MRLSLIWLAVITLSACGWHLRGISPIPDGYRILYLQGSGNTGFDQALNQQLQFNGVVLTEHAVDAPAQLVIQSYEIERRTLSLSTNGQVAEYELNGRLSALLSRPENGINTEILVRSRRTLSNDVNNVVATANEERQQRSAIEKDLASKLLRRLQGIRDNKNTTTSTPATQP